MGLWKNSLNDREVLPSVGFYLNAGEKDLGSNDLDQFVESLDKKTSDEQGRTSDTVFARNVTLMIFLSQLLIFSNTACGCPVATRPFRVHVGLCSRSGRCYIF